MAGIIQRTQPYTAAGSTAGVRIIHNLYTCTPHSIPAFQSYEASRLCLLPRLALLRPPFSISEVLMLVLVLVWVGGWGVGF
jgi:hypothetical protein